MPLPDRELDALSRVVRELPVRGTCLEIGTAYARTLIHLMGQFDDEDRPPFVTVDPMTYFDGQADKVRANLAEIGLADAVRILEMTSAEALRRLDEPLAFVFIDGDHRMPGVTTDLRWARRLRPGGALCLHDYRPDSPGVRLAADRFLRRNPHYQREDRVDSLLILRKTAPSTGPEVRWTDHLFARLMAPLLRLRRSMHKRLPSNRS